MCNRYVPARGVDVQRDLFGAPQVNFPPPVRLGIGQRGVGNFVRLHEGVLDEVRGQWGMIEPRSPTQHPTSKKDSRVKMTNNARSETMASCRRSGMHGATASAA